MSETTDDLGNPSDRTYQIVFESLRDYMARTIARIQEEGDALNAIPGYRDALAQANSSEDARRTLIARTPEVAAVQGSFSSRSEDREAEMAALIAAVATLDESGVERLLAETWEGAFYTPVVLSLLGNSRNPCAVAPLIARLQREVPDFANPYTGDRFQNFVDSHNPSLRRMERETREMHRFLDRRITISVLERIGDGRAVSAIQPFLNDPSETVREAAQKALNTLNISRDIET